MTHESNVSPEEASPVPPSACNCNQVPCPHSMPSGPKWGELAKAVMDAGAECGLVITEPAARHLAATVVSDHQFITETERDSARLQAKDAQQDERVALSELATAIAECDALRLRAETAERERDEYRSLLIYTGRAINCGLSDDVSLEFLRGVPHEAIAAYRKVIDGRLVAAERDALKARAESAEAALEKHGTKLGERQASRAMAIGIIRAVDSGILSSRSMASDAAMSWCDITFDVSDGSGLRRLREEDERAQGLTPSTSAPAVDWKARAEAMANECANVERTHHAMRKALAEAITARRLYEQENAKRIGLGHSDSSFLERWTAALEGRP